MQAGNLYFNTITYFKSQEDDARFDTCENLTKYLYKPKTELWLEENKINIDGMIEYIAIDNAHNNFSHLWCCSHILCEPSGIKQTYSLDEKMREFGDHVLLFTNTEVFYNRMLNALRGLKLYFSAKPVFYLDKELSHTEMCIHNKLSTYMWQKEYRVALELNTEESCKINIGSLTDISVILPLDKLNIKY